MGIVDFQNPLIVDSLVRCELPFIETREAILKNKSRFLYLLQREVSRVLNFGGQVMEFLELIA